MRQATSLGDRQMPPKPVHCVKVRPFHGLQRTVTKGRNFESSGRPAATKAHQETFRSTRFVRLLCASLRVGRCVELPVWRHPSSSAFFKGTRQALALSIPSLLGLNTVSTEKSSSLANGQVTQGLEGKADVDTPCSCRANDVPTDVDSRTISTHKKTFFEVTTEKKKKREK